MFRNFSYLFIIIILFGFAIGSTSTVDAYSANFSTLSGGTPSWTTDGNGETVDRIAATTFGAPNNIYQSVRGSDNKIYTRCLCGIVLNGSYTITPWTTDTVGRTYNAVALASFSGKLFQSVRGLDNKIYTRSSTDASTWSGWQQDSASYTPDAITLATFNGKLYQAARGTGDQIYTRSTSDGTNWSNWIGSGGTSPNPIAMTTFDGKLYQGVRGSSDNKIYTRYTVDGSTFSTWERDDATYTPDAISLANGIAKVDNVDQAALFEEARGTGNRIYIRSKLYSGNWTSWQTVEFIASYSNGGVNVAPQTTLSAPTVVTFRPNGANEDYYVTMIRGTNNKIYWL